MKCQDKELDSSESAIKCSIVAAGQAETGSKRRNPIWAGVLSLLMPGLGQTYNGQALKGLVLYVAAYLMLAALGLSGLFFTLWGLIIFLGVVIFLYVAIIAEAALTSRRLGTIVLRRYNRWYVYVLLIVCAGVLNDSVWTPFLKLAMGSAKTYRIPSPTMEPTLKIGDHIVVRVDYYTHNKPKESDIVVFRYPEDHSKDFVKRVVALEGQRLEIRNKRVLVNDEKIEEPWAIYSMSEVFPVNLSPRDNLGPITIPTGHVFVMGDNRDFSFDSRFWGPLDIREIRGKALYIYWADDKRRIGNVLQ